jgi:hypothetical protein
MAVDNEARKYRLAAKANRVNVKWPKGFKPGTDVFGPQAQELQRRVALAVALREVGVKEVGGNNRGPRVEQYQAVDDIPGGGYAWCADFVAWCYRQAGWPESFEGWQEAYVPSWVAEARGGRHGLHAVANPGAGDLVAFDWQSDGKHDHIGMVRWAIRVPGGFVAYTVEGNTSGDSAGSQDDGGGVYKKRRFCRDGREVFIRVTS